MNPKKTILKEKNIVYFPLLLKFGWEQRLLVKDMQRLYKSSEKLNLSLFFL